jgi:hypothetical protein
MSPGGLRYYPRVKVLLQQIADGGRNARMGH